MRLVLLAQTEVDRVVERVLSQPKFQSPPESLWDRLLDRGARWLASLVSTVVDAVGGPVVAGVLALVLLVGLTAVAAARVARRQAARVEERLSLDRLLDEGIDPAEVDRIAAEAEARGDLSRAVRARFLAGLVRLHRRGAIRYTRGTTTGQISDQLGSPLFDSLARTFEEVAYGGREATRPDLDHSVEGWRRLLAEEMAEAR